MINFLRFDLFNSTELPETTSESEDHPWEPEPARRRYSISEARCFVQEKDLGSVFARLNHVTAFEISRYHFRCIHENGGLLLATGYLESLKQLHLCGIPLRYFQQSKRFLEATKPCLPNLEDLKLIVDARLDSESFVTDDFDLPPINGHEFGNICNFLTNFPTLKKLHLEFDLGYSNHDRYNRYRDDEDEFYDAYSREWLFRFRNLGTHTWKDSEELHLNNLSLYIGDLGQLLERHPKLKRLELGRLVCQGSIMGLFRGIRKYLKLDAFGCFNTWRFQRKSKENPEIAIEDWNEVRFPPPQPVHKNYYRDQLRNQARVQDFVLHKTDNLIWRKSRAAFF